MKREVYISAGVMLVLRYVRGENITKKEIDWYNSVLSSPFPESIEEGIERLGKCKIYCGDEGW